MDTIYWLAVATVVIVLFFEPLAKLPRRHLLRGSIRSPGAIFLANEALSG